MKSLLLLALIVALIALVIAGDPLLGQSWPDGRFRPEHCCAWIVTVLGRRSKQSVAANCCLAGGIYATIGAPLWVKKPAPLGNCWVAS